MVVIFSSNWSKDFVHFLGFEKKRLLNVAQIDTCFLCHHDEVILACPVITNGGGTCSDVRHKYKSLCGRRDNSFDHFNPNGRVCFQRTKTIQIYY